MMDPKKAREIFDKYWNYDLSEVQDKYKDPDKRVTVWANVISGSYGASGASSYVYNQRLANKKPY